MGVTWRLIGRGRLHFPMAPRQLHGLDKSLHAKRVMITCDCGGRRCFGDVLQGLRCERAPAGVLPREMWSGPYYGEDWARRPLPWRLLRRRRCRRFQRLRRALRDSGDERRQLRAPEPAPLLEQGGLVRPPPTLIWMGLAPVLDGPLLMMASSAGAHVVSVPLGSIPCEESKSRPVGACKVPVILFC